MEVEWDWKKDKKIRLKKEGKKYDEIIYSKICS